MTHEFPRNESDIEREMLEQSANEVALAVLGFEHASVLASDSYAAVIRGSLDQLVATTYYYADEDRACVRQVSESLVDVAPKLGVRTGRVVKDGVATGEIEFEYSIELDAPWSLEDDPMDYQKGLGDMIVLDGMGFKIRAGRVIVTPGGRAVYYEKPQDRADASYIVAGADGQAMYHPDSASLFPAFSQEQQAQIQAMALLTTEAFIRAYGTDPDVLWDKTAGVWWDVKSPGTRDMWREVKNRYDPPDAIEE